MAAYRFLAVDALTHLVREQVPFEGVQFTSALNGAGGFSGSLPLNHPKATREVLDPARTLIYVERDGVIVWSGFLWNAKADTSRVTFDGAELWSYFRQRLLRTTLTFNNVDTGTIAAAIMLTALGEAGSFGLHHFDIAKTGTLRTVNYYGSERKVIATLVEDLAKQSTGGFDFAIISEWNGNTLQDYFALFAPRRGRVLDFTFEDGANAEAFAWTIDGTKCANRVDVIGSAQGASASIATGENTELLATYPLLETVETASDNNNYFYLWWRAQALIAATAAPQEVVTVTGGKHPSAAFGNYGVGDTVQLRAANGYMQVGAQHRVTAVQVQVGEDGAEVVTPEFAKDDTFT